MTLAKFFLNMNSSYGGYRDSPPGEARLPIQITIDSGTIYTIGVYLLIVLS